MLTHSHLAGMVSWLKAPCWHGARCCQLAAFAARCCHGVLAQLAPGHHGQCHTAHGTLPPACH
ncbi:MAG: hypothetical protein ACK56I_11420, partial [bacterium]